VKRARRYTVTGGAVLLILLIAVVLAGCGSSEKIYTDSTYGYSFTYPGGWKVQGGTSDVTAGGQVAGNVGVYDPQGTKIGDTYVDLAMVMVYQLSFTVDDAWSADIQTELEGVLSSLETQTSNLQLEKALSQTTMAGLRGYTITYTFTKDGTPMRSTLFFLFDRNREYELTEQAAVAAWDTAKPTLDGIIGSFRPGKAK
jgi:hypothetical protein